MDEVVAGLSDQDLMAPSRCRGWAVGDVLAHLHLGLQEMLTGFAYLTDDPPDTDLSTYWNTPLRTDARSIAEGALAHARFVRLLASAHGRPTGLVSHLRPTVAALIQFTDAMGRADRRVRFQGHVLPVADFIATWVVEGAVRHLDIGLELDLPAPPPGALALTARTLDGLGSARRPGTTPRMPSRAPDACRSPTPNAGTSARYPLLG